MTQIKEEQVKSEERAKLNRRAMIGGVLMGAGTLLMNPAHQDIYFMFSFLLWSLGAHIMCAAKRGLSKLGPPPIVVKQKNKRFLVVVIVTTVICVTVPFVYHVLYPRLNLKLMFVIGGIPWLLVNVFVYCKLKKTFAAHDGHD